MKKMPSPFFFLSLALGLAICSPMRAQETTATYQRSAMSEAVTLSQMSIDDRVARLERELAKAQARIEQMDARFKQHTHNYNYTHTGLLNEPLNGRRVDLAISPTAKTSATTPPNEQ